MAKPRSARTLIIIGGHEDRVGEMPILKEVAERVGDGPLVVTTAATTGGGSDLFHVYDRAFAKLGVKKVQHLMVRERAEALDEANSRLLEEARGLFITGGDQLRITSQIGDTPVFVRIHDLYQRGGVIAGTSAGAAVFSATMLVSGASDQSHRLDDSLRMAPGLGLIEGVIIEQHFAERGRIGRLTAAVAQNPAELGVGIDENTAVVVENETRLSVIGDGAVYILDGSKVTASNIAEAEMGRVLSIFDVTMHLLSAGDRFDLRDRRPQAGPSFQDKPA